MPLNNDFKSVRTLGKGHFGSVKLYKYKGRDKRIIRLTDANGLLAVKEQAEPDINEHQMAKYLETHQDSSHHNQIISFVDESSKEQKQYILSEYVSYDDIHDGDKIISKSSDVEKFLQHIALNAIKGPKAESPEFREAFKNDFGVMLSQLVNSMHDSQKSLHELNIIHRDTALRNFMVEASKDTNGNLIKIGGKIIDYGLSMILPKGENQMKHSDKGGPLYWMTHDEIFNNTVSIKSDHYAFRVALLGMIGISMSDMGTKEILHFKVQEMEDTEIDESEYETEFISQNLTLKEFFELRQSGYYADDINTLQDFVINARKNIALQFDRKKKNHANLFLDCYADYILNFPDSKDFQQAQQQDAELLISCNNQFVRRNLAYLQGRCAITSEKSIKSRQKILLSLHRLSSIKVNDKQLKDQLTNTINELDALGVTLPTPQAINLEMSMSHRESKIGSNKDVESIYLEGTDAQSTYLEGTDVQSTYIEDTDVLKNIEKDEKETTKNPVGQEPVSDDEEMSQGEYVEFTGEQEKVVNNQENNKPLAEESKLSVSKPAEDISQQVRIKHTVKIARIDPSDRIYAINSVRTLLHSNLFDANRDTIQKILDMMDTIEPTDIINIQNTVDSIKRFIKDNQENLTLDDATKRFSEAINNPTNTNFYLIHKELKESPDFNRIMTTNSDKKPKS